MGHAAGFVFSALNGQVDLARIEGAHGHWFVKAMETYAGPLNTTTLAALKKKYGLKGPCALLLAPNEYRLLQTDAPETEDREELLAALRWKVKELVDFPVESATLDALDLKLEGAAAARGRQCLVAVAKNDVLAPKIQAFQAAKIDLQVIDIPELAQRNIANLFARESRGQVFLNFGPMGGMLTFTFGGELYVDRLIEIPLETLEQVDEQRRSDLYDRVALEVQRSIDNFERGFSFITLSVVQMLDLPSLPGLVDYLQGYLSLPVEAVDLTSVLEVSEVPELRHPRRQAECLRVLGAALRGQESNA